MNKNSFFLLVAGFFVACNNTDEVKSKQSTKELNHTLLVRRPLKLDTAQDFQTQYDLARNDLMMGKAKYYFFGIHSASKFFIDSMKNNYNVDVISLGCTSDKLKAAYNAIIDSFLLQRDSKKK